MPTPLIFSRKCIVGMLVLVMFFGVLAVVFWPEKPEPVYKGKKLSWWIVQQTDSGLLSKPAEEAVLAIGTNGIPFYLGWLEARDSQVSRSARKVWTKFESLLGVDDWRDLSRKEGARLAFSALEGRAAGAIPALEKLALNSPSPATREKAYYCLQIIKGTLTPLAIPAPK